MQLLKHIAPKQFFKRWAAPPPPRADNKFAALRPAARPVCEPIETIVDRFEANLPSIHRLICLNREVLAHRRAEMAAAEAERRRALRASVLRALGALPLGTLALEVNETSHAGLAGLHASEAAWVCGAAAAVLFGMSATALRAAMGAQRRRRVLMGRQDELQGAIERETRAAARTRTALDTLTRTPASEDTSKTSSAAAARRGARWPQLDLPATPKALCDTATPPPGWPGQPAAGVSSRAQRSDISDAALNLAAPR